VNFLINWPPHRRHDSALLGPTDDSTDNWPSHLGDVLENIGWMVVVGAFMGGTFVLVALIERGIRRLWRLTTRPGDR